MKKKKWRLEGDLAVTSAGPHAVKLVGDGKLIISGNMSVTDLVAELSASSKKTKAKQKRLQSKKTSGI